MLGLTFKPGTDDLREAPSLVNVPILLEDGANVRVYDPVGGKNFKKYFPDQILYCKTIDEALYEADLCFILTEWDEVVKYNTSNFENLMRKPIVLDGRNCFKLADLKGKKFIYESIGRPVVKCD